MSTTIDLPTTPAAAARLAEDVAGAGASLAQSPADLRSALSLFVAAVAHPGHARRSRRPHVVAAPSGTTLRFTMPILLAGLAGLWAERVGIVNIGIEGMMIFGTWFGGYGAWKWGPWVGLLARHHRRHARRPHPRRRHGDASTSTTSSPVSRINTAGVRRHALPQRTAVRPRDTRVAASASRRSSRLRIATVRRAVPRRRRDRFGWETPDILGWFEKKGWLRHRRHRRHPPRPHLQRLVRHAHRAVARADLGVGAVAHPLRSAAALLGRGAAGGRESSACGSSRCATPACSSAAASPGSAAATCRSSPRQLLPPGPDRQQGLHRPRHHHLRQLATHRRARPAASCSATRRRSTGWVATPFADLLLFGAIIAVVWCLVSLVPQAVARRRASAQCPRRCCSTSGCGSTVDRHPRVAHRRPAVRRSRWSCSRRPANGCGHRRTPACRIDPATATDVTRHAHQ